MKEVFPAAFFTSLPTFLDNLLPPFLAFSFCLEIVFEAVCLASPADLLALPATSLIGAVRLAIVSLVVLPIVILKINHHVRCQNGGLESCLY